MGYLVPGSGLPVSEIVPSTTSPLGVGSIELGHASDTTISRVSAGVAAIEGFTVKTTANTYENQWSAKDSGLIAWSFDPAMVLGGVAPTGNAGLPYLVAVPIRAAATVTNVLLGVYTAGSGLTSSQCFAGLYQGGTLLAATADQSTAWASTGVKTMALTSPQAVTAGVVYVAFFFNGTTPPAFWTAVCASGNSTPGDVGTPSRWGVDTAHAGRTTSFAASSSINVPTSQGFWAGVS